MIHIFLDLPITTRLIDSALITGSLKSFTTTHHWDTDLKILRFFHGIQKLFQAIALQLGCQEQADLIGILIRASYLIPISMGSIIPFIT